MRTQGWAGLAVVTLAGVMATTAFAQPPQGGGRGRGFAGGMGFGPMPTFQLAGNSAVQKELAVTDDQAAKLKALGEEAVAEMRPSGGGTGGAPSDEERAAMRAKRAEAIAKFKPKLAEILNAQQVERLDQIALQQAGPQAFAEPAVAKKLDLSKDQQDKLASITRSYQEKQRELMPARGQGGAGAGGGGDFQERMAKMRELNESRDKDLTAVLTTDQQKQFAAMKGKDFDLAQLRGGFGGGRGQGRPERPQQ